jgi:hypothetical protein
VLAAALAAATPAWAGPPYVTDDPEPTDTGRWENYVVAAGSHVPGQSTGETGVDLNHGGARDLQLSLSLPVDYDSSASPRFGFGDVRASAKYRFLHQAKGSWLPDVAAFPEIDLPTAGPGFGAGHASLFLPLWAQKDFGGWSIFGGGGYRINPGPGRKNSWFTGWAATHQVTPRLQLGAEGYRQTSAAMGEAATTAIAAGVIYRFNARFALLASGGPSVQAPPGQRSASFFTALEINY